eukprot:1747421-Prymnesium_polylepis.1
MVPSLAGTLAPFCNPPPRLEPRRPSLCVFWGGVALAAPPDALVSLARAARRARGSCARLRSTLLKGVRRPSLLRGRCTRQHGLTRGCSRPSAACFASRRSRSEGGCAC